MRSNICNFFRNGHCKMKLSCNKSHDILTCRFGPFCPVIETCHFRHPPLCVNFLNSKCGFFKNDQFIVSKNCSKFHFPSYLPPPPLAPPPLSTIWFEHLLSSWLFSDADSISQQLGKHLLRKSPVQPLPPQANRSFMANIFAGNQSPL